MSHAPAPYRVRPQPPLPERHALELAIELLETGLDLADRSGIALDRPRLEQALAQARAALRRRLIARQRAECDALAVPTFMPADGYCDRCGADLLADARIGRPQAIITGCRQCHVSFCD